MMRLNTHHLDIPAMQARARPNALACVELESRRRYSYLQLHRQIERCAAWIRARLGHGSGERIAMLCRNNVEMVLMHYGCGRAGAIFQPLNWRLAPAELAYLLQDGDPRVLIYDGAAKAAAELAAARPQMQALAVDAFADDLESIPATELQRQYEPLDGDRPMTLLYTSGTSGRPKGAVVTNASAFFSANNFMLGGLFSAGSVMLCDLPLFHVLGLLATVRAPLMTGGLVLISQGFDADLTFRRLTDPELGVTHYVCVPQIAQMLRGHPRFASADLSKFPILITGGAPIAAVTVRQWLDQGVRLANGYGMTEAGSVFMSPMADVEMMKAQAGTVGQALLGIEARLVRDDGHETPQGEVGELWLRGPGLCAGYWNRPEETADAFTAEGWFRTGDAARMEADGCYAIVDRRKDMYISGGENVYPAEVEAVLAELDVLSDCAVVGVPDLQWGEVGCAFVRPAPGAAIDLEALLDHCRRRLARYKVPKHVVLVDALPRTASGKVLKPQLLARWRERQAASA